jgi:hypothetical protein
MLKAVQSSSIHLKAEGVIDGICSMRSTNMTGAREDVEVEKSGGRLNRVQRVLGSGKCRARCEKGLTIVRGQHGWPCLGPSKVIYCVHDELWLEWCCELRLLEAGWQTSRAGP